MKHVWVQVDGWRKDLVTAALEAGADALVLDEGLAEKARALGRITIVAPDGDLKPDEHVLRVAVESRADEQRAAEAPPDRIVVLALPQGEVIPLENLIARRGGLLVEVADAEAARLAVQALERGADGVVTRCQDPAEVRRIVEQVHAVSPPVPLTEAEVVEVRPLGMGDRVCVDTCSNMGPGEGLLAGNASSGLLLVHSESIENPYVAPRPFRVNAGAVHAYTLVPDGATRYLGELAAGDEVLLVDHAGRTRVAYVGRAKVERRPLLLVRARAAEREAGLVLQNAETIRLVAPGGAPLSVAAVERGDRVLAHFAEGGRHFGVAVEETIDER